jgi:hypothetical protein
MQVHKTRSSGALGELVDGFDEGFLNRPWGYGCDRDSHTR